MAKNEIQACLGFKMLDQYLIDENSKYNSKLIID